ncbi:MAG: NERD domain-containing protein [Bdellovibrionaceae bacterium]|nr:NERD domain-containing protein [Pseudobdellovibrionaceae bacterium]MDW8189531.1 nuclease-related domain-containing protein [Pseudobdellovibrionaceae bacterium]
MLHTKQKKGYLSEQRVLAQLNQMGWIPLGHRISLWNTEIDLMVISSDHKEIWLIEVKTVAMPNWAHLISPTQKKRIEQVLHLLIEHYPQTQVRGHLALVSPNTINWIYDFFTN